MKYTYIFCLITLLASTAGCGDDFSATGLVPDAAPNTEVDAQVESFSTALAVAGVWGQPGIASTIVTNSNEVVQNVLPGAVSGDVTLRALDDYYVILNRSDDNIVVVNKTDLTLVAQVSTGAGSNPHDVAVSEDFLYVAMYGGVGVAVIDRANINGGVIQTIDLSSFDTADGIPDCETLVYSAGKLFVACQLLENFSSVQNGIMVVVDTQTNQSIQSYSLPTKNPFGMMHLVKSGAYAGELLVSGSPFDGSVGCVARFPTQADPPSCYENSCGSEWCLVTNDELGGFATKVQVMSDDSIWLAVNGGWSPEGFPLGTLHKYDPVNKSVSAPLSSAGQQPIDFAECSNGDIVVADRANDGVYVFDLDLSNVDKTAIAIGNLPTTDGIVCN